MRMSPILREASGRRATRSIHSIRAIVPSSPIDPFGAASNHSPQRPTRTQQGGPTLPASLANQFYFRRSANPSHGPVARDSHSAIAWCTTRISAFISNGFSSSETAPNRCAAA